MFNLFKKKENTTKVSDLIWMTSEAKWQGMADLATKDHTTVFVFWFDDSFEKAREHLSGGLGESINITMARQFRHGHRPNESIVFAEHHPLTKTEQELFQSLQLEEVTVLSALDEPLFKRFGSDKIIQLMKQMGMDENQSMENELISKAIRNAQQKIERKVTLEQSARSQSDWLEKNLPVNTE